MSVTEEKQTQKLKKVYATLAASAVIGAGAMTYDAVETNIAVTKVEQFCKDNDYTLQQGINILRQSITSADEAQTSTNVDGNKPDIKLRGLDKANKKFTKQGRIGGGKKDKKEDEKGVKTTDYYYYY